MNNINISSLAKVKLIASDLDGTLLNSKSELSNSFFQIYKKLREKNILFVAASGRQYYSILRKFEPIKDDILIIAENGSYVRLRDDELLVQALDKQTVDELLIEIRTINRAYPVLCGRKTAYVENDEPEFLSNVSEYYTRVERVGSLLEVKDDDFLKITVCDLAGAAQNSYLRFGHLVNKLQVKVSGTIWLDIAHILANKGNALATVQQRYGISKSETMAFGDYFNDIEMLHKAGFSFAVANAQPEVKAVACFAAKSNDDGGVMEILEMML